MAVKVKTTTLSPKQKVAKASSDALRNFNKDYSREWKFGMNWSSVNHPEFETYINDYLFPKLNESWLINIDLGNRFNWLAKEVEFIGQFSEEYVFMDTVPVSMNLDKPAELMLKRNYPAIATKFYGEGVEKKLKFTLNDNAARLKFMTINDGVAFALGKLRHAISQINLFEEMTMRAMLIDYSTNVIPTSARRIVTSQQQLFETVFEALLDLQDSTSLYNETALASGGLIGRRTTKTKIEDVFILTTNKNKRFLLDTKLANTFQVAGIDPSSKIMSFADLGGVYKATEDFTITEQASVDFMKTYGDYQVAVGDKVFAGDVFIYDVSELTDFEGKVQELKPDSEYYAYVCDVNKIRYNRYTKNMISGFVNNEFGETNHWVKYYVEKRMSPFFNSIVIM